MKMSTSDKIELALGILTGLGYGAELLLPNDCAEAGFEMGASGFMIYSWYANKGFTVFEKIVGPLPDYAQLGFQSVYMYKCIKDKDTKEILDYVSVTKLVQATFLTWVYYFGFQKDNARNDYFVAAFSVVKQLFNGLDAILYMNKNDWKLF